METIKQNFLDKIKSITSENYSAFEAQNLAIRGVEEGERTIVHISSGNNIVCLMLGLEPDMSYVGKTSPSNPNSKSVFSSDSKNFEIVYFKDLNPQAIQGQEKWFKILGEMESTIDNIIQEKPKVLRKK